ncbi:MAG: class I SAM-dependent DNA methyltransferase [Gemmatimonadota bacterium]
MGSLKDEFHERAKTWDDHPDRTERAAAVARRIREEVPLTPQTRVLDFGAGTGLLGFQLIDHVASVSFADPSEGMLQQVERKLRDGGYSNGHVIRFDPEAPALPGRYDVIVSLMTLHHVADPADVLRFLASHLEPGGWLAVSDLDTEDGSYHDPPDPGVHAGFDRGVLLSELHGMGFVRTRAVTPYVVRKERPGRVREYPLFLITGRRPR